MSIEGMVIDVLGTGKFDRCPSDVRLWSDAKHREFFKAMEHKGFFLISSGDFDTARETIDTVLTERQGEI